MRTLHIMLPLITGSASLLAAQSGRTHVPQPTSAAISAADLRTRLYIIADDSMEGRDSGHRGSARAAAYIAGETQRLGLTPGGENGTFFQAIPLRVRRPDSSSFLRVGDRRLVFGTDFIPYPRTATQTFLGGQPFGGSFDATGIASIYGGRIGDSVYVDPASAAGKAVLFAAPRQEDAGALQRFYSRGIPARYASAALIGFVRPDGLPAGLRVPRDAYDDPSHPWNPQLTVAALSPDALMAILGKPPEQLTIGEAGHAISGRFGFLDAPTEVPAQNIVAILPGSDPTLRAQYVALGAHYDHVGILPYALDHDSVRIANAVIRPRGGDDPRREATAQEARIIQARLDSVRRTHPVRLDSINNGADDDGSGSALMLELAESFAKSGRRPKRSLLFVWHTAEEKGLYGAQYFSDHPTVPRDSIVAQINMDQMGRGEPEDNPPGGRNALVVIGSRRLSTELGDMVERQNAASHSFRLDYEFDRPDDPNLAYCRSDHYMYARYGIPVVFFVAAAWYRDYHMVSDEPQYIAYDRMANIGRFIRTFVADVADLNHRPVVDKPKPDPYGACTP